VDEEAKTVAATGHRSEIAEIKIAVTAPQSIVLFGAGIGGLIAYFLLPNVRLRPYRFGGRRSTISGARSRWASSRGRPAPRS
jgi:hypothetical protein